MALDQPPPSLPGFNPGDAILAYSKILSYLAISSCVGSNSPYRLFVKFAIRVFAALVCNAAFNRVLHVSAAGIPSKVFNVVVLSVAVNMAAIKFFWHWPVKGAEYKTVNRALKDNGISDCKPDMQIAVFRFPMFKHLAINSFWPSIAVFNNPVFASNIAKIRSGIRAFKFRDWFPNFHNGTFLMAPLCHKKGNYNES